MSRLLTTKTIPRAITSLQVRTATTATTSSHTGLPDAFADKQFAGRTGGGKKLDSSSENAPPPPKVLNNEVSDPKKLTKEQKEEVDKHNQEFEQKYDRGARALDESK